MRRPGGNMLSQREMPQAGLPIAKSARRTAEIVMQTAGSGADSPSAAHSATLPIVASRRLGIFGLDTRSRTGGLNENQCSDDPYDGSRGLIAFDVLGVVPEPDTEDSVLPDLMVMIVDAEAFIDAGGEEVAGACEGQLLLLDDAPEPDSSSEPSP